MLNFVSMALLQVLKLLQLLLSEVFILCSLLLLAEGTASLTDGPGLVRVSSCFSCCSLKYLSSAAFSFLPKAPP